MGKRNVVKITNDFVYIDLQKKISLSLRIRILHTQVKKSIIKGVTLKEGCLNI